MSKEVAKTGGAIRKWFKKRSVKIFLLLLGLFFLLSIGGCSALYFAGNSMIDEKKLTDIQGSIIYSNDGKEVTKLQAQNMEEVSIDKIPKVVKDAFIATEDTRFYSHNGIDPIGIGRAILKDITSGTRAEGASTITQQLARNIFLPQEATSKSFLRKTKEIMIALNLERRYSKDQILEMYLNRAFYANHGVFGVQAASKYYFGKPVEQLNLTEAATLAAIPKAPSHYAPEYYESAQEVQDKNKDTIDRRNLVLSLMYENKYITKEQMDAASKESLVVSAPPKSDRATYQAYLDYITNEAETKLGIPADQLYTGAYKIYTYLDPQMQESMYKQFQNDNNFPDMAKDKKIQGAMLILESKTGGITAMVGGRDYQAKGWNHTTHPRPTGSTIKPLVDYAPALEMGWTPNTIVQDIEKNYGTAAKPYIPSNYTKGSFLGPITMADAIKKSENAAAVWTLNEIGINKGVQSLKKFEIPVLPEDEHNLSIALGGLKNGVAPIQMAQAYAAFDNNGTMNDAHVIKKITTADDRLLLEEQNTATEVVSPQTAYYMTQMLQGVVQGGTGTSAALRDHPVAGKTGTQQYEKIPKGNTDAWFVGFTPDYVGAVWMGYDYTDENHYVNTTGGSYPARLFHNVMTDALKGKPVKQFNVPNGVKPLEPPTTLSTISDLAANVVNNQVQVTWSGGGKGDIAYKLYRFEGSTANKQLISDSKATSFTDAYDSNKNYSYVVVPYDKKTGQEGTMSNMATVKAPTTPTPDKNNPGGTQPSGQNNQGGTNGGTTGGNNGQGTNNGTNTGNGTVPGTTTGGTIPPIKKP